MAEESLRDSINAAIESNSGGTGEGAPSTPTPNASPSPLPQGTAPSTPASAPSGAAPPAPSLPTGIAPAAPTAPAILKAPTSWKPEAREKHWTSLSPEVQQEILRREQDITRNLQESANARKHMEAFQHATDPYRAMIEMEGGDPMKAYGDYLRTAAVLRQGQPIQKAQVAAQIVQQFGIDVNMLDEVLSQMIRGGGQGPQPSGQHPSSQYSADPRLDKVIERLDAADRARQAEIDTRADSELTAFQNDQANEFYEDVKMDMANLLDVAAAQGRVMTLQQAYDTACFMHPEVGPIVKQRQLAIASQTQAPTVAAARTAASSITSQSGDRGGGQGGTIPDSLRGAIEAAYNKHVAGQRL